ncbi:NUDIX domain-containing protein [Ornithinimicrobium faecis]|uniref:NUDIX domain-containing protein n=1 Tax=Ornithinimicrobium faecis TaxID=2934158 RepID=UPI002117A38D|nr:NUDIX domain-containing protein [Ornithinimicrobium sp. HY1745]
MDFDTRVGCYAWIEQDGQVLLAHWSGHTRAHDGRHIRPGWTLPGGGLEPHESCEQATVREVAEESGYAVRLTGLLGTGTTIVATPDRAQRSERPMLLVQLVYAAEITSGHLTVELDGSTDDVRWVPLEELSSLPCAGVVDLALDLQRRGRREGPVVDDAPLDEEAVECIVAAARAAHGERHGPARRDPPNGPTVIAIDGPSGSGKTTLAEAVAQDLGAPVVHMDDFYPGWDGLAEAVDLVTDQVLEPLARGERAAYRVWDWATGDWGRTAAVPTTDLLVLEGCGSSVGRAGDHAAVRVWVDADEQVRHQRGIERDGDTFAPHWDRWAAQEQALFGAAGTAQRADITLHT